MSDLPPARTAGRQKTSPGAGRNDAGASGAPSNVKIYDRPERSMPSLLVVLVPVLVLVVLAVIIYRIVQH